MTKSDLISAVSAKTGVNKKESDKMVNAVLDVIVENLAKEEKVSLVGFGTFEVRHRKAREGVNPSTGKPMPIPATTVPAFKAGKALKEAVAK